MTPACVAFMGLCIIAPYNGVARVDSPHPSSDGRDTGPGPALVRRLGVEIELSEGRGDHPVNAKGADRVCNGASCTGYVKSCSSDNLRCSIEWGPISTLSLGGRRVETLRPHLVSIKARTAAAMAQAQAGIFLELQGRGLMTIASLSVSSTPYRPHCKGREEPPSCMDMGAGLLPEVKMSPGGRPRPPAAA